MATRLVRIHPTADISDRAQIGEGTQIWNNSQVREGARIGTGCILGKDVYVDTGVQVGDRVKIQNGAQLFHGLTVGSGVFIGPGVIFTNDSRPRAVNPDGSLQSDADWAVGETVVEEGASVGAGAIILPGLVLSRYCLVGAGAVVTRDVGEHSIVTGNPARHAGYACVCGSRLEEKEGAYECPSCGRGYDFREVR